MESDRECAEHEKNKAGRPSKPAMSGKDWVTLTLSAFAFELICCGKQMICVLSSTIFQK
jgi:hypothetical protein